MDALDVTVGTADVLGTPFGVHSGPLVLAPSNPFTVEGTNKFFDLGQFSDQNTGPWNVDVNWGDGTPHTTFIDTAAGSTGIQGHLFGEDGTYTVTVTVTDSLNM